MAMYVLYVTYKINYSEKRDILEVDLLYIKF